MSLTKYDHEKKCQVLDPSNFVINAFHKDYVKTYMPEFLSGIRLESMQKANGVINGGKSKASREAKNKAANTINLNPREYHTYSKAGVSNVKPKGVKK